MHFSSRKILDIFNNSYDCQLNIENDSKKVILLDDFIINNNYKNPFYKNFIENPFKPNKNKIIEESISNINSLDIYQIPKTENKKSNKEKEKTNKTDASSLSFSPRFETNDKNEKENKEKKESIVEENKDNKMKNYLNKKRKAGRKTNIIKKENSHTRDDPDNIQRKIQVNYLTFLINMSNDALLTELGAKNKSLFKHINYASKQNIKFDYVENLKSKSIKNILQMDINNKYLKFNKSHNYELLEKVCLSSKWLKNFFDKNYLEVFEDYYYNNQKPLKLINFQGKDICISKKTKSFYYLVENYKEQEEKLKDSAKTDYMDENNRINNFKFYLHNNVLDQY